MSMYMSFFIRGDNKFYPIGTYSRATAIYQMFNEVGIGPWEKISPISYKDIDVLRNNIKENIKGFTREIDKHEFKLGAIERMKNPLVEKIEIIEECTEIIHDYKERVRSLEHSESFVSFIEDIMDEYKYTCKEEKNPEEYVYVGIEVCEPTCEDIC